MATPPHSPLRPSQPAVLPAKYWLPLIIAIAVTAVVLGAAEFAYRAFNVSRGEMVEGMELQAQVRELQRLVTEAESAQRGFILTRKGEYLPAYQKAVEALRPAQQRVRDIVSPDKPMRDRLGELNELLALKLAEMKKTVELGQANNFDAALALIDTDEGRRLMDSIGAATAALARLGSQANADRARRWDEAMDASRTAIFAVAALNAVLIGLIALILIRDTRRAHETARLHASYAETMRKEVDSRTEQLSSLSQHLQTHGEHEKATLARELHDELGGILTPAKMDVSWLSGRIGTDPAVAQRLSRLETLLESGIDVKRRIIENLRPSILDHLGLGPALRWHFDDTCRLAGLACEVRVPDNFERLAPDLEIAIFRTAQESLSNVVKHANAKQVRMALERTAEGVGLRVEDDGRGIGDLDAARRSSHGLAGMSHRVTGLGGRFDLQSAPGKGTTVTAFFPVQSLAAANDKAA